MGATGLRKVMVIRGIEAVAERWKLILISTVVIGSVVFLFLVWWFLGP
jgi:hypothetical protein